MIKLVIKLALAALVANATWRLGSAYMQYYRFKDALFETAQYGNERSRADLRRRVMDLASQYDIPLADDSLAVQRDERSHMIIDAGYTQPVDLLPMYRYRWVFNVHVDVFTTRPPLTDSGP